MRITGVWMVMALAGAAALEAAEASGTLIVLNKTDGTASLLDLASGKTRAILSTEPGPHEVGVSHDGRLAVVTEYGSGQAPGSSLSVIDVARAEVLQRVALGDYRRPHGIAWSADGASVYVTAEESKSLLEIDPQSWKVRRAIPTEQEISHMVALARDGRRAFVANIGSGTMTAIELAGGRILKQVPTGAGAEGIAVSPDGSEVWVTNRAADTVTVVDAASLEVQATLPCPSFPIRIKFTPGGDRALVSCARSGEVAVFDARGRELLKRIKLELAAVPETTRRIFGDRFGASPVPVGILILPGGDRALVASTNADAVSVLDLQTSQVVDVWAAGKEPDGLGFSPIAAAP
jgi:YVTN family beta-propeller protein